MKAPYCVIRLLAILLPILLAILLGGCAAKPSLPLWTAAPVSAQFSLHAHTQGADIPLQGGLHLNAQGGTMAIILQHGRTLGYCTFTPTTEKMHILCRPAEGMDTATALLGRIATAVYTSLQCEPSLFPKNMPDGAVQNRSKDFNIVFTELTQP